MAKAKNPLLDDLKAACKGLLFPSETDAPVEPVAWPDKGTAAPDEAALRTCARLDKGAPVQKLTLSELVRSIPGEVRGDFLPLFALLADRLTGVAAFKVGETNLDVYIVGRAADGQLAGVKTQVVET